MTKKTINLRFGIVAIMILLAALSRLLPHPPNVTPIGGMALFGAAYFAKKYWAYLIPFLALWISDLLLNNIVYAEYQTGFAWITEFAMWNFLAFGLIIFLGSSFLKKIKPLHLIGASLGASTIFFLVTNFGSWIVDISGIYSSDLTGLLAAYTAGLPLFLNTLVGDLFYVGLLFGSYELIKQQYPKLAMS